MAQAQNPSLFGFPSLFDLTTSEEAEGGLDNMGSVQFDTDSILIALDVCASASIGTKPNMSIDLKPLNNVFLSGVGGRIPA